MVMRELSGQAIPVHGLLGRALLPSKGLAVCQVGKKCQLTGKRVATQGTLDHRAGRHRRHIEAGGLVAALHMVGP